MMQPAMGTAASRATSSRVVIPPEATTGMSTAAVIGTSVGAAAAIGGAAAAAIALSDSDDDDDDEAPEGTTPCNEQTQQGSNSPESHTIYLGERSGTFIFEYDTAAVRDRMQVAYEGRILFDSGCVGTNGNRRVSISYSGNNETVRVNVIPNCAGGTFTWWQFTVRCP